MIIAKYLWDITRYCEIIVTAGQGRNNRGSVTMKMMWQTIMIVCTICNEVSKKVFSYPQMMMNIRGEAPCHDYCEILRDSEASCEDYCEILMLAPCHDYCEIFAILREGFIVTASIRHLASVTRPCCREISTNQRPVSWSHDHSQPIRGQGVRNLWQYFPPVDLKIKL